MLQISGSRRHLSVSAADFCNEEKLFCAAVTLRHKLGGFIQAPVGSDDTPLLWTTVCASRQSDAHQLRRQSLQCSWTSESGTICRRPSDSRTCHTAVSDTAWSPGRFSLAVAPQRSVNLHVTALYKHCYLTCMGRCTFILKSSKMKRDTLIPRLSQTAQKPNCAPPPMRLAVV